MFIVTAIRRNPQNDRLWLGGSPACHRGNQRSIPGQYTSQFTVQNVTFRRDLPPFPLVLRFSPDSITILSLFHIFPIIYHWFYFVSLCVCVYIYIANTCRNLQYRTWHWDGISPLPPCSSVLPWQYHHFVTVSYLSNHISLVLFCITVCVCVCVCVSIYIYIYIYI